MYAITSEPQHLAERARSEWALSFACVADPHHEIADGARQRGWLDLHTQEVDDFLTRDTPWEVTHPNGFFQPGVLAIASDKRLLYRWCSVPTRENGGGAARRPKALHVWGRVKAARIQGGSEDAALDAMPELDAPPVKFPLFAAVLMAHGWFLRPKPFAYQGDGKDPMARIPRVMGRLAVFAVLWLLAFAFLPALWVGAALLAYLPVAAHGVRKIYRTFQNVKA